MPTFYPVFLNLRGRRCVIVGGGGVAERKAQLLRECGASVTFVSPEVTPAICRMAERGDVRWHQREYRPGDLDGAFIAIAATDDSEVNRAVHREAQECKVLLNVVDMPSLCSFIAPSVVRRGEVMVAISTGGLSPALARRLREELPKAAALEWADLAPVLAEVRRELRARGIQPDPETWQASMDEELLGLVQRGGGQRARELLLERLTQPTASSR